MSPSDLVRKRELNAIMKRRSHSLSRFISNQFGALRPPELVKLQDEWRKTRGKKFMNEIRNVMSLLFRHGIAPGLAHINYALHRSRSWTYNGPAPRTNRPWTTEEREAVWEPTGTLR
jgi:hypothetical protein